MNNKVYVVNYKSTGEIWQTAVYGSIEKLEKRMAECRMKRVYSSEILSYMEYQDSVDKSQTATATEFFVI